MQPSELTPPAGEDRFSLHRPGSALARRLLVAGLFALGSRFPFSLPSQRAPHNPVPAETALVGTPRRSELSESRRRWGNNYSDAAMESLPGALNELRPARRVAPPGAQPPAAASERRGKKPTPTGPPIQHQERQRHKREATGMAPGDDSPPPPSGATMPAPDDQATTLPPPGLGEPSDGASGDGLAGQTAPPAPGDSRGAGREAGRALLGLGAPFRP